MQVLHILLLVFIISCAVSVSLTKNLLTALVIFMGQSLAMSVIWILLESPDLAITRSGCRRRHHEPASVRDAEENPRHRHPKGHGQDHKQRSGRGDAAWRRSGIIMKKAGFRGC